jgi:hypothetical protein
MEVDIMYPAIIRALSAVVLIATIIAPAPSVGIAVGRVIGSLAYTPAISAPEYLEIAAESIGVVLTLWFLAALVGVCAANYYADIRFPLYLNPDKVRTQRVDADDAFGWFGVSTIATLGSVAVIALPTTFACNV